MHALPSLHDDVLFEWKQPVTALQRSFVQGLLSLHCVAVVSVKTHPVAGLQLSTVHTLLSLQTTVVPGRQVPAWHESPVVQALPSLQEPLAFWCLQP